MKTRIHPHPRMAIDFFRGLRHPNKPLNLEPYITPYLSNDKAVTRTCLEDKRICRQLSPVELIKAHITNRRAIENVEKIPADKPIMIVAGQKDQVFKTSALPAFAKRIGSKQVSVQTLPNKGHLMLEAQEVDADVRDAVDIWLAKELQPIAPPPSVISGVNTARFSARIPTWLQASIQRYSPMAMARASLQHAREWTTRLTSQ